MHPDLSPNLHTDECNKLIKELFDCRKANLALKFFGACNGPYDRMLSCLKSERMARRDRNAINAKNRQQEIRNRMKEDNTDYDELLQQYRKDTKQN